MHLHPGYQTLRDSNPKAERMYMKRKCTTAKMTHLPSLSQSDHAKVEVILLVSTEKSCPGQAVEPPDLKFDKLAKLVQYSLLPWISLLEYHHHLKNT